MTTTIDRSILQAALVGYRLEAERIATKIAEIERELGGKQNRQRRLSPAARKCIAMAQKKRWAAHRKAKAAAAASAQ